MYKNFFKRLFDVMLVLIGGIILLPIVFIACIFILVIDHTNPIFTQARVGKNGKIFNIYKLRTMKKDENGINQVTKFGKILRLTSIDELPQFFNILKGEMSFIGPRPWIVEYTKYFDEKQKRRTEVLPGITGWAQVNGRNELTIKNKINLDLWYVDNISLRTDVMILLKTIAIIFNKSGASITEKEIQDELKELKKYQKNLDTTERIVNI